MKDLPIVAVRDVDPSVPCNGMRINGCCRRDAVFPFLLHLGVHDKERVVWEVDGDLALGVFILARVGGEDPADTELSSYA